MSDEKEIVHRKTLTRDKIKKAMIVLMSEKDVSQMSVSEICQKACVNRTSFYNNYTCITDVLQEYANDYFLGSYKKAYKLYSSKSEKGNGFDLETILLFMKDNKVFSNLILKDGNYLPSLIESSLPDFNKVIEGMLSKIKDEKLRSTAELFFIKGFEGAMLQWINSDEGVSAAKEAEYLIKLAGSTLSGFANMKL